MLEQKTSLIEASAGLKAGMFVGIKGYRNEHGEVSNVVIHADASYDSVHDRSAKVLDAIENGETEVIFTISRNAWVDAAGTEHTRKAKDRTLKTGITETITNADKDFAEAIAKVRKACIDPKTVNSGMEKVGNSLYDNDSTGRTYMRNVLVHSKTVLIKGDDPVVCSARVTCIADALKGMTPLGQYRTYVLEDGRFESVNIMSESVSSSSSEE